MGSTSRTHLSRIVFGLGTYFFPFNTLSKQKRTMRRRMGKPYSLKVKCYAAFLVVFACQRHGIILIRWSLMKSFWTVCQMNGVIKCMCRGLIVKLLIFKRRQRVGMHGNCRPPLPKKRLVGVRTPFERGIFRGRGLAGTPFR